MTTPIGLMTTCLALLFVSIDAGGAENGAILGDPAGVRAASPADSELLPDSEGVVGIVLAQNKVMRGVAGPVAPVVTPKAGSQSNKASKRVPDGGAGGTPQFACVDYTKPWSCSCTTISDCEAMEDECVDPEKITCKEDTSHCKCDWKKGVRVGPKFLRGGYMMEQSGGTSEGVKK